MSITVTWDNSAHTIVRWDFVGHWDWEDFLVARQQSIAFIQSASHIVNVIIDVSRSPRLPPGILGKFITVRRDDPANLGQVALVGASRIISIGVNMVNRIIPSSKPPVVFTDTIQQARTLLMVADTQ